MNRLIIVGSPRTNGRSAHLANMLFETCIEECPDDELALAPVSTLSVAGCTGCDACRDNIAKLAELGEDAIGDDFAPCAIDDDMQEIYGKIQAADIIIESFPLYFFGMPGTVKVMTDRLLSMLCTYRGQKPVEGESFHGIRYDMSGKRFLLVSTCGYAQTDLIYDALLREYDCICGAGGYQALLCPQGKVFSAPELRDRTDLFLEKFTRAGEEFAKNGVLSEETLKHLQEPPFNERRFRLLLNKFWNDEKNGH